MVEVPAKETTTELISLTKPYEKKEDIPPGVEAYVENLDLLEKENAGFSSLWKKEFVRIFEDKYPKLCDILRGELENQRIEEYVLEKPNSKGTGYTGPPNFFGKLYSKENRNGR